MKKNRRDMLFKRESLKLLFPLRDPVRILSDGIKEEEPELKYLISKENLTTFRISGSFKSRTK